MTKTFPAIVEPRPRGGSAIRPPFDPNEAWGPKARHNVNGTIGGHQVRGTITTVDGEPYLQLGPSWCRDPRVGPGAQVDVALAPEGPELDSVADDIAAALTAEPAAGRFFESLPTFYRKNFIRWIEEAKRAETRAKRIAETVTALNAGRRER